VTLASLAIEKRTNNITPEVRVGDRRENSMVYYEVEITDSILEYWSQRRLYRGKKTGVHL
jgi:hypothetical protein